MAKPVKNIFQISDKPMSFYVPAGVKKGELVDLITRHGGKVVRDEKAADVVLWEKTFHNDGGHQIISKNFVYDSVKSGKLQDNLKYAIKQTPKRPKTPKKGRTGFTSTDDRVLLELVSKNPDSARGNKIYKELEAKNRRHTWQSWRDRYIKFLAPNQRKSLGPSGSSDSSSKPAFKKRRLSKPESNSDSENDQPLTQALDYQDVNEEEGDEDLEEEEEEEVEETEEERQQRTSDEEDEISIKIKSENEVSTNESDVKKASGPLETQGVPTIRVSMTESYIIDDSDEDNVDQPVLYEEVTENTYSLEANMDMIDETNGSNMTNESNEFESPQEDTTPAFESYEEITQQTQEDIDEGSDSQMISESQLQTQVTDDYESDIDSQPLQSTSHNQVSDPNAVLKSPLKENNEIHNMEIELQIEEDDAEMSSHDEADDMESQDVQPLTQKFTDTLDESIEDLSQDRDESLAASHASEEGDNSNDDEEMDDAASNRLTQLEQAQQDPESLDTEPNVQNDEGEEGEQIQRQSATNTIVPISENPKAANDPTTDRLSLGDRIQQERQQLRAASTPITRNRSQTPVSHQQSKSGKLTRARSNTPVILNQKTQNNSMAKVNGKPPVLPRPQNTSGKVVRAKSQIPVLPHEDHESDKDQDDTFIKYRTLYLRMIKGLCIATNSAPEAVVRAIKLTSGNFLDAEQILLHGEKKCSDICWTAAEDQILLDGDNSDIIQELLNKKGHERTHLRNQFLNFYSESL